MLCVKCVINVVVCPLKCNNKTNSEYILGFNTTNKSFIAWQNYYFYNFIFKMTLFGYTIA